MKGPKGKDMMSGAKTHTENAFARIRRFHRDHRGIAAVEFAMIAPILIAMYFMTLELGLGIEASKKVGRTASIVADLVTQNQTITKADLDAIMRLGEGTMQPYNRSSTQIYITAVQISSDKTNPRAKVVWSRKAIGTTTSAHTAPDTDITTSIPTKLLIADTFLIRVETKLDYKPVLTWNSSQKANLGLTSAFDNIAMDETYHLRPRMSVTIPCGDC